MVAAEPDNSEHIPLRRIWPNEAIHFHTLAGRKPEQLGQ